MKRQQHDLRNDEDGFGPGIGQVAVDAILEKLGDWPKDAEDCLYISVLLATSLLGDLDEHLVEFPEEAMTFLEERCKEDGLELEDCLLEMMVESREPSDPI